MVHMKKILKNNAFLSWGDKLKCQSNGTDIGHVCYITKDRHIIL